MKDRIFDVYERSKVQKLRAAVEPLLRADKEDWKRLEAHLAKDMSGHGRFWQEVLREVRQAMMSIKEDVVQQEAAPKHPYTIIYGTKGEPKYYTVLALNGDDAAHQFHAQFDRTERIMAIKEGGI